jgi:hypothetical protein
MAKIEEVHLQGMHSRKEIAIRIDVVVALVNAYMTVIPNEKRDLSMSLKVLRLHDDMKDMLMREVDAVQKEAEKRIDETIGKGLGNNEMPV